MSERKEFRLKVPDFTFTQFILPEVLESESNKESLKTELRSTIKKNIQDWLNTEFDEFFEEAIQENSERWEKEKHSFSDRLLLRKTD